MSLDLGMVRCLKQATYTAISARMSYILVQDISILRLTPISISAECVTANKEGLYHD